jgi:hypothetical protein
MENRKPETQFREDEIAFIRHYDKQRQEWVVNPHPKVGGRLRLAHESNEALSIETVIIKYDGNSAVVSAVVSATKGHFKGIGMASIERDKTLADAILELAETRAIARALRFAGYGVEYFSAEEVSHLENGNSNSKPEPKAAQPSPQAGKQASPNGRRQAGNQRQERQRQWERQAVGKTIQVHPAAQRRGRTLARVPGRGVPADVRLVADALSMSLEKLHAMKAALRFNLWCQSLNSELTGEMSIAFLRPASANDSNISLGYPKNKRHAAAASLCDRQ